MNNRLITNTGTKNRAFVAMKPFSHIDYKQLGLEIGLCIEPGFLRTVTFSARVYKICTYVRQLFNGQWSTYI